MATEPLERVAAIELLDCEGEIMQRCAASFVPPSSVFFSAQPDNLRMCARIRALDAAGTVLDEAPNAAALEAALVASELCASWTAQRLTPAVAADIRRGALKQ